MKMTKDWMKLPQVATLTLPSTDGLATLAEVHHWKDVREYALSELARLCGGVIVVQAEGGYVSQSGQYIVEKVEVATSYTKKITPSLYDELVALAMYVKDKLHQESVLLTVNGTAILVGIEEE